MNRQIPRIIGALLALIAAGGSSPAIYRNVARNRVKTSMARIRAIGDELESNGELRTCLLRTLGLTPFVAASRACGAHQLGSAADGWGEPFLLMSQKERLLIISPGRDGLLSTTLPSNAHEAMCGWDDDVVFAVASQDGRGEFVKYLVLLPFHFGGRPCPAESYWSFRAW